MKTVLHMHRITIANRASLLPLNECLSLIEYVDLIFIIVVLGDNLSRDFSKLYPLLRAKNFHTINSKSSLSGGLQNVCTEITYQMN